MGSFLVGKGRNLKRFRTQDLPREPLFPHSLECVGQYFDWLEEQSQHGCKM